MEIAALQYHSGRGWSQPDFPDLDSAHTLVLVFGAPEYLANQQPLRELRTHYPNACFLGCSTAGEILGQEVFDRSLSVGIARFARTRLRRAHEPIPGSADSESIGIRLARSLAAPDLAHVLLLSDGLQVNGSALVRGATREIGGATLTGGLAADGTDFRATWLLDDNCEPVTGQVTALGFYGDAIQVSYGSMGGWDIFGPERVVTRSEGNVLYELDGRPALDLYRKYLGDQADGLPAKGLLFPLSLRRHRRDQEDVVRTILAVDPERNSLTFAGDVPQGWLARLMRANFERLVSGAEDAAGLARCKAHNGNRLVLAISCMGRRLVLGERAEEETEAVYHQLMQARDDHMLGFYSYGEIAPHALGDCKLHNQTMTITTLSEA
ncbi:MAG: FIST C-terminal domain-containing protein [Gammaproteobacteria bacterium]|nr:FIST C-terminal domain-containing protein [Gammaproteobacteria bacterium]